MANHPRAQGAKPQEGNQPPPAKALPGRLHPLRRAARARRSKARQPQLGWTPPIPPPPLRLVLKMPPAKQDTRLQTGELKPCSKAINPFIQMMLLHLTERVRFPIRSLTAPTRAAELGFTWRAGERPGGRALPRFIGVFQRCVQLLEALLQRVALVVLDQLLGRMERHPGVSTVLCVTCRDGAHAQKGLQKPTSKLSNFLASVM